MQLVVSVKSVRRGVILEEYVVKFKRREHRSIYEQNAKRRIVNFRGCNLFCVKNDAVYLKNTKEILEESKGNVLLSKASTLRALSLIAQSLNMLRITDKL